MNKHQIANVTEINKTLEQESCNTYKLSSPWTWRDRLRNKIFPPKYCDLPKAPFSYLDVFVCRTTIELSFLVRLRVFLTGRLMVDARTVTENIIGNTIHESTCYALPWRWFDPVKIPKLAILIGLLALIPACSTSQHSTAPQAKVISMADGPPSPCEPNCPTNGDYNPPVFITPVYTNGELASRVVSSIDNQLVIGVTNVNPFREYELQFTTNLASADWQTVTGKLIGNTNEIQFDVMSGYAHGFFRAADVTGDDVIVYPTFGGGSSGGSGCPGAHVSYYVYLPTTNVNFPFQPVGTNHSMTDPTGSSDTRIESVGRFGDYHCHASPLVFPAMTVDPYYTMTVYFKTVAKGTNYPMVLKGFIIRPDMAP